MCRPNPADEWGGYKAIKTTFTSLVFKGDKVLGSYSKFAKC